MKNILTNENAEKFIIIGFDPTAIAIFATESARKNNQTIVYLSENCKSGSKDDLFTSNINEAYLFEDEDKCSNILDGLVERFPSSDFIHTGVDWVMECPIEQIMGL